MARCGNDPHGCHGPDSRGVSRPDPTSGAGARGPLTRQFREALTAHGVGVEMELYEGASRRGFQRRLRTSAHMQALLSVLSNLGPDQQQAAGSAAKVGMSRAG